ncbi:response regulator transcription factor, partial [Kitasatospora sp. LaBMicrA B282]|uniref:response regulator transcription factor n=1 Tax=Kitasatospora sp. LaBMicrA B282 TaxID=3420949 RepID=UPI003D0DFF18
AARAAELRGDPELVREVARLAERAGVARALRPEGAAEPAGPDPQGTAAFQLTPRETDVLRLLAEGRTNRQIAEELFISPKTASVHVSNILAKLEVSGRGEAAALAHRLRLFPDAGTAHGSPGGSPGGPAGEPAGRGAGGPAGRAVGEPAGRPVGGAAGRPGARPLDRRADRPAGRPSRSSAVVPTVTPVTG